MAKNRKAEVDAAAKQLDFSKNKYQVVLDTHLGKITLDMLPEVAPGHVKNLVALAKIGYYEGLTFHRVISGFMIQGGCPEGTGTGGPGYTIPAEFNATKHTPGVVSMARTNDPNSAGSQFFICLEAVPHLDRQYTAFGRTADAESLAVVKKIGGVPTGGQDRPVTPVTINKATVVERAVGDVSQEIASVATNLSDEVRCPACNSTQVTAQKKGFQVGNAAVGGVLLGAVGLFAGAIGSGKIIITCLKCGHEWPVGK